MNNNVKSLFSVLALGAAVGLSGSVSAHDDHRHGPPPPADATVGFGILPLAPLGPPPCLQSGGIGGPTDPCSFKIHRLTIDGKPVEEVTVTKGGQVTFDIHGGGHGVMIYQVSKNTTRDMIGQALCVGTDPLKTEDPAQLACNLSAANASAVHVVRDGKGDVILDVPANDNAFPNNRVWSPPGRLMSADGQAFLNGGAAATPANANSVSYRFLKTGRYLVMCMNRTHALNDWMFGFVNVVDSDRD